MQLVVTEAPECALHEQNCYTLQAGPCCAHSCGLHLGGRGHGSGLCILCTCMNYTGVSCRVRGGVTDPLGQLVGCCVWPAHWVHTLRRYVCASHADGGVHVHATHGQTLHPCAWCVSA